MAVKVIRRIPKEVHAEILDEIIQIAEAQSHEVTPRSRETLESLLDLDNLYVALDGETLLGWVVVEPLTKRVSELGMAYVKPEFRGQAVLEQILSVIASRPERIVLATYNQGLLDYAISAWNCREVSLLRVVLVSRGRFISKRLNKSTRSHVSQHLSMGKPKFALTGVTKK